MYFGVACLLVLLALCVFIDVKSRKVPNLLIVAGLGAALISHMLASPENHLLGLEAGTSRITVALSGIVVGFGGLFPLYALRAMGAGDVKLMMMVGAFLGPLQTAGAVVLTFAAGGVLAIGMALWHRTFPVLFTNLRFMITHSAVKSVTGQGMKFDPLVHTAGRMPYAVAIAAGTILQLILLRSGGWALS